MSTNEIIVESTEIVVQEIIEGGNRILEVAENATDVLEIVIPGRQGPVGPDGRTILNGSGAPGTGIGANGDFYIDTTASEIYGPKTLGSWGPSTSILGPQGPPGASALADLTDVDVTQKTNTSVFYYKSSAGKFVADDINTITTLTDGGNF